MFLLVFGLVYGAYRWRLHSLESQKRHLEIQVADRTQELATFFDLAIIEREGTSLVTVIAAAMPRILAASRSQAIAIHLFADDGFSMQLIGQEGLLPDAQTGRLLDALFGE